MGTPGVTSGVTSVLLPWEFPPGSPWDIIPALGKPRWKGNGTALPSWGSGVSGKPRIPVSGFFSLPPKSPQRSRSGKKGRRGGNGRVCPSCAPQMHPPHSRGWRGMREMPPGLCGSGGGLYPQFSAGPPVLWPSAPRLRANPRVPAQWEEGNPHPRERLDTAVSSRLAGEGAGGARHRPPAWKARPDTGFGPGWVTRETATAGGALCVPQTRGICRGGSGGVPSEAPSSGAPREWGGPSSIPIPGVSAPRARPCLAPPALAIPAALSSSSPFAPVTAALRNGGGFAPVPFGPAVSPPSLGALPGTDAPFSFPPVPRTMLLPVLVPILIPIPIPLQVLLLVPVPPDPLRCWITAFSGNNSPLWSGLNRERCRKHRWDTDWDRDQNRDLDRDGKRDRDRERARRAPPGGPAAVAEQRPDPGPPPSPPGPL